MALSRKEEGVQAKTIRTMINMFRANCMEVPREIVLTYGEFEAFKRSLGNMIYYTDPPDVPRIGDHTIRFYGVIITRQPCTCGAL